MLLRSSLFVCKDISTSSGFAGESSKPREYCDPFEVAEVLSLHSVSESSLERLSGWFKALAAKLVPRVDTGLLCFWRCDANSARTFDPDKEKEVRGSVLCDVGFLYWCCDASSERESVEETKLFSKGGLL